ncbi:hypothetical protein AAEU23_001095 [Escherichia coli]|nr:hypothetical protein [Escherichia coli]EGI8869680.1 hypothetical protein [Escherichia coli]MCV1186192.1 hypothetical protein [Escherichia coli]QLR85614.1 hypothetical protein HV332_15790 [Escherichia coli]HAI5695054.1 hypothetical protein [Escherichia coli]
MHPLTHPLPVTAHAPLLDVGILTPARATNSGLESKKPTQSRFFYVLIQTSFQMNAQRLIHTYTFLYTYIFVKPYVFLTCPLWFVTLVALALHLSFTS